MSDPNKTVDEPGRREAPAAYSPPPERIGRYRIEQALGQGGFGIVYLAQDEQLRRLVAIKVPHARLVAQHLRENLQILVDFFTQEGHERRNQQAQCGERGVQGRVSVALYT